MIEDATPEQTFISDVFTAIKRLRESAKSEQSDTIIVNPDAVREYFAPQPLDGNSKTRKRTRKWNKWADGVLVEFEEAMRVGAAFKLPIQPGSLHKPQ